ncbi:MAG: molybdopterin-dependent oxidoreductase [Chitinophagaceae bacterium]
MKAAAEGTITLPFENGVRKLAKYPQKRERHPPPPFFHLRNWKRRSLPSTEGIFTPNDAFFVRYHLSNIPLSIDPAAYRLEANGLVDSAISLSLEDLKTKFEAVEVAAVNQCSGNSRGFFKPRVGEGQASRLQWSGAVLPPCCAVSPLTAGGAGSQPIWARTTANIPSASGP